MTAMSEVRVDDRDRVRWITLDRSESRNGLTPEVNRRIIEALAEVNGAPDLRAVVLAGAGGNFCSGLDLKTAGALLAGPEALRGDLRAYFHGLIRAVRALEVPSIAAIDGAAVGFGLDLSLAFDLRLASERARFSEVFARRGLMPDGGSTYHLPRLIGVGRALELMYTGDVIEAGEAHRVGLVNRLLPVDGFEAAVAELATRLAAGAPLALRAIKEAVYRGLDGDLDAALEREENGQIALLQSADVREGVAAFLQKRPPKFSGK